MSLRQRVAVALAGVTVLAGVLAGGGSAAAADPAPDVGQGGGEMSQQTPIAGAPTPAAAGDDVVPLSWAWRFIEPGEHNCGQFEFCIWWATSFGADRGVFDPRGVAFFGSPAACEGVDWRGTRWENHTFSIKNNTSGTVRIWNWLAGPTGGYARVFEAPRGSRGNIDRVGGRLADAMSFGVCAAPGRLRFMDP